MPGSSFPPCRIEEGIALVSPEGVLVLALMHMGGRCATLSHRASYIGDPWASVRIEDHRRPETGKRLDIGLGLVEPLLQCTTGPESIFHPRQVHDANIPRPEGGHHSCYFFLAVTAFVVVAMVASTTSA